MVNKLVLLVKEENNISFDTLKPIQIIFRKGKNNREINTKCNSCKKNVTTKTKED